jgi:hypothetical protein
MNAPLSRRQFVRTTAMAAASVPVLSGGAVPRASAAPAPGVPASGAVSLPGGKICGVEFSRLMLGGNLISGYAHSRDLAYVAQLMKRYNTDARIFETLELAETQGINVMNSWVMDGNNHLQAHWKRGGKMKWIAQVRVTPNGNFDQVKRAVDLGATAIHPTGDASDLLIQHGKIELIGKLMEAIREQKCLAGIGAHGLGAVTACEKAGINPDFYVKTLHTHDYHTAPSPDETDDLGRYDNSWCNDPEAVVDFMFAVRKPWIAFKVLAAGAIPPQRGFRHAFESGADFILVGMFDWQIAEDTAITRQVLGNVRRLRAWQS